MANKEFIPECVGCGHLVKDDKGAAACNYDGCIVKQLQAENKRLKEKRDNSFEIYIPNLRSDEVQYGRDETNRFTKDLLNKLTEQRKHRN